MCAGTAGTGSQAWHGSRMRVRAGPARACCAVERGRSQQLEQAHPGSRRRASAAQRLPPVAGPTALVAASIIRGRRAPPSGLPPSVTVNGEPFTKAMRRRIGFVLQVGGARGMGAHAWGESQGAGRPRRRSIFCGREGQGRARKARAPEPTDPAPPRPAPPHSTHGDGRLP
jgi:hypothetical protein